MKRILLYGALLFMSVSCGRRDEPATDVGPKDTVAVLQFIPEDSTVKPWYSDPLPIDSARIWLSQLQPPATISIQSNIEGIEFVRIVTEYQEEWKEVLRQKAGREVRDTSFNINRP